MNMNIIIASIYPHCRLISTSAFADFRKPHVNTLGEEIRNVLFQLFSFLFLNFPQESWLHTIYIYVILTLLVPRLVWFPNTLGSYEVKAGLKIVQVAVHVLEWMIGSPVHAVTVTFSLYSFCHLRHVDDLLHIHDDCWMVYLIFIQNIQETWKVPF